MVILSLPCSATINSEKLKLARRKSKELVKMSIAFKKLKLARRKSKELSIQKMRVKKDILQTVYVDEMVARASPSLHHLRALTLTSLKMATHLAN